jgi:acyl-CoA thioester hydrolase
VTERRTATPPCEIDAGDRSGDATSASRPSRPFAFGLRVYYEDTDAAGIVYYANYLRFMERARTEWMESLGFPLAAFEAAHGVTFAVMRAEIDFLRPARLDDRLSVGVEPRALRGARLDVGQPIRRGGEVLVRGLISLACIDRVRLRPARIPRVLVDRLRTKHR